MKRFFAIVFLSLCSVSLFAAEDHRKDEIELEPIELPMVEIAVSHDNLQGVERDFLINSFALNEAKNDNQLQMVLSQDYRDPSTMLFLSIFLGSLGVDRFMLGETGLGVLKLVTAGGLGVWWLIDIFSVEDRTKEYNGKLFDETLRNAQLFLPAEETQINDNLLGSWN